MNRAKNLIAIAFFFVSALIYFIPNYLIKENITNDPLLNNSYSFSSLVNTAVVPNEELFYAGQISKLSKGSFFNYRFKIIFWSLLYLIS